jgi:hypothetical protein
LLNRAAFLTISFTSATRPLQSSQRGLSGTTKLELIYKDSLSFYLKFKFFLFVRFLYIRPASWMKTTDSQLLAILESSIGVFRVGKCDKMGHFSCKKLPTK